MLVSSKVNAEFPKKLKPLFEPKRYKVLYGGRGGAKSWGVARALLILGVQNPIRVLCAREFQNSMDESVHRLLSDQIDALNLHGFYEIQKTVIKGLNGSEFKFEGLRNNVKSIKSFEGADICWVEEAQSVSKASWDTLIPTIRKEGSEIWITFNPELEEDETYIRFVKNPPESAWVERINFEDNPWFPDVLRQEMETTRKRSEAEYRHIWLGECVQHLEGAYYAEYLNKAEVEGRIGVVPIDPLLRTNVAFDLGISDDTSIVFWQQSPAGQIRVIDYYEHRGVGLEHYVRVLEEKKQQYGLIYGEYVFPHDVEVRELGTGKSRFEMLQGMGIQPTVAPRLSVADGIAAVRKTFPAMWFDKERCSQLIHSLRRYRREFDEKRNVFYEKPLHDAHSHAADSARYMCISLRESSNSAPLRRSLKGIV